MTNHSGGILVLQGKNLFLGFRVLMASLCLLALTASSAFPLSESQTCKMLVWGGRLDSYWNHDCANHGQDCSSCSSSGTCWHQTTYVDGWQVCQCLCGHGADQRSACHVSVHFKMETGEFLVHCQRACCSLPCKDKTGNASWSYHTDPCRCELPQ